MDITTPVDVQRIATKALIIDEDGNYLVLREASAYEEGTNAERYQLPGGRLNIGEYFEDGLRREVMEETGLEVEMIQPIHVGEWRPVIKGVRNQIVAIFFLCRAKSMDVFLSTEHDKYAWLSPTKNHRLTIIEPDSTVIKNYLRTL